MNEDEPTDLGEPPEPPQPEVESQSHTEPADEPGLLETRPEASVELKRETDRALQISSRRDAAQRGLGMPMSHVIQASAVTPIDDEPLVQTSPMQAPLYQTSPMRRRRRLQRRRIGRCRRSTTGSATTAPWGS